MEDGYRGILSLQTKEVDAEHRGSVHVENTVAAAADGGVAVLVRQFQSSQSALAL